MCSSDAMANFAGMNCLIMSGFGSATERFWLETGGFVPVNTVNPFGTRVDLDQRGDRN